MPQKSPVPKAPKRTRNLIPGDCKVQLDALIASYGGRRRMGSDQEKALSAILDRFPALSRKSALNYLNNRRAAVRKSLAK